MPPVPTSCWLAVGAVAAALAGPSIGPRLDGRAGLAVELLVALGGAVLAAILFRPQVPDRGRRGRRTAALVLGAAVILLRLAVAGSPPGEPTIPAGDGPWTAVVLGIGTPRDGQQAATLGLEPGGLHVAATLPRYPEIAPGDRVSAGGALRAVAGR